MIEQISIRKRSLPEWSALLLVFLPFVYSFFTELIGLPGVVRFTSDVFIAVAGTVVFVKIFHSRGLLITKKPYITNGIILIFLLYVTIGYVFNYQSVFYFIWGVRNNFRFYFAFLIFVAFMDEGGAKSCLNIIEGLFWVHFVVTLVQYSTGLEQDFLGGIFGSQKGCNGYTVAFLCIVVAKSLLSFMNGDEKTVRFDFGVSRVEGFSHFLYFNIDDICINYAFLGKEICFNTVSRSDVDGCVLDFNIFVCQI